MKGIDLPDPLRIGLWIIDVVGDALDWMRHQVHAFHCGVVGHHWIRFGDMRWCARCKEGL